jgi:uncharacterized protein YaaR (DUF327 family)
MNDASRELLNRLYQDIAREEEPERLTELMRQIKEVGEQLRAQPKSKAASQY